MRMCTHFSHIHRERKGQVLTPRNDANCLRGWAEMRKSCNRHAGERVCRNTGEACGEGRFHRRKKYKLGPATQVGLRLHMKNGKKAEKLMVSRQKKRESRSPYQEGAVTWGAWREPTPGFMGNRGINKAGLVVVAGGGESKSHWSIYF